MKIYLVDFENVKSKGLQGIDNLTETDTVIIFYSENSDTINFEMHQKVLTSKADIEYFKVNVGGKNALDFQLSTLLGYLVAKDTYTNIFVISNDRGFDFLHDFWHGKYVDTPNATVYRTRTIQSAINFSSDKSTFAEKNDVVEKADEIDSSENVQEIAETSVDSGIVLNESTEPSEEPVTINYSVELNDPAEQQSDTEEEPEACAPDIVKVKTEQVETAPEITSVRKPRGRKKRTADFNGSLHNILSEVCGDEQIAEIGKLIGESNTKEEFHNALAKIYKQQATDFYKLLRPKYLRLKGLYVTENPQTAVQTEKVQDAQEKEEVIYHDVLSVKLSELLGDKCGTDELDIIRNAVAEAATKQQLYIKMVKKFKKEKGCDIYNAIRSEYVSLHKLAAENKE